MNRLKQLFPYAGLIAVSLVFWIALWSVGLLDGLEKEVMRWRYLARGELQSTTHTYSHSFFNVAPSRKYDPKDTLTSRALNDVTPPSMSH